MSDKSKIEWTDTTWNPVTGCSKVSQGCKHCYAEREWTRLSAPRKKPNIYTGREFTDVQCHPERLDQPLRWKKPRRIFVNSMSDLFHEDIPEEFIDQVFAIMAMCPQHIFQVLTKRPERMQVYCSDPQTPFRVARAVDVIHVDQAIYKTPYEIRQIPGLDKYFIDNKGVVWTNHGSGYCVWCGTDFDNGQQDSIFCSQKCRSSSHYAKTQGRDSEPAGRVLRRVTTDVGKQGHARVRIIGGDRELVHRVVLRTCNREPRENEQACHKDGNPTRNHICNLKWGTQEDNWQDRRRHGNAHSHGVRRPQETPIKWPLLNCWAGVSVEDQDTANERIPLLLATPAAVRWLSIEPLLGAIDLAKDWPIVDWVVVGGESGPKARPMHPAWVRFLRNQCQAASVPFLFKQWGEWSPVGWVHADSSAAMLRLDGHICKNRDELAASGNYEMKRVGKRNAGRELDGRTWGEYPAMATN